MVLEQLSFDDFGLTSLASSQPEVTRVRSLPFRWRKLVRLVPPPAGVSSSLWNNVANAIADYADADGGSCYPSVGTLAVKAGVSRRAVQLVRAGLEERGLVVCDRRGGRGRASEFQLVTTDAERVHATERVHAGARKGCTYVHPRSAIEDSQYGPAVSPAPTSLPPADLEASLRLQLEALARSRGCSPLDLTRALLARDDRLVTQ